MSRINKRISSFFSLLLLIPLLIISSLFFPYINYGLPKEQRSNDHYLSSLRDPTLDMSPLPQSGIYRNKDSQNSPYFSISEIIPEKAVYFPEETISVTNRFNSTQTGSWAIVRQEIRIFINSSAIVDLNDNTSLITTAVTNGADNIPAISQNLSEGIIDVSFALPEMTNLTNRYGISPGDTVSLFQYYPGGATNDTANIEGVLPFVKVDYFIISGFSTLAEVNPGFVNPASGDSTFRQGEEATVVLKAQSGSTALPGLTVTIELHDGTTDALISNSDRGIDYSSLDMITGLPSTTTDANGELRLNVSTNYPTTPENNYYFIVNTTINPVSGYFTENYDGSTPASNFADSTANFTILNEKDIATVEFVSAVPSSAIAPPNENSTLVTFRVNIDYAYTTDIYQIAGIPLNATLSSHPAGISLQFSAGYVDNGSGWAVTDGSGIVQFVISAGFPIPYEFVVQTITAYADLRSTNAPAGAYPTSYPNNLHRFIRSSTGMLTASSSGDPISIDPDFWIGDISLNSITSTSIRPGESATLVFEVNTTAAPDDFSGVPVKIELNQVTAGVSLSFNPLRNPLYANDYRYTDLNGMIEVTVSTIYLTTPEILKAIILDLTVDFENDSQPRWIGNQHLGTASFAEFDTTWRTAQDTSLSIDPQFTLYEIIMFTTNESGDTEIRSGDILEVTFRVQSEIGSISLSGVDVNVVLGGAYPGVTLVYVAGSITDGSGDVTVRVSTTYPTTPKNLNIILNATADLTSDTGLDSEWKVGQKSTNPSFYSNSSYSDVEETILVDPQYFFGEIAAFPADNPVSRIGQTEWIDIEFTLYLTGEGTVFPNIDDINISITVDGNLPGDANMNVIPGASYQDSASSKVTFSLQATGTTPEKWYTINATAHFGDAQGLTYNITHSTVPSGALSGVWVNGSHTNDISFTTFDFEVKNVDRIQVLIQDPVNDITDGTYGDAGLNVTTGYYEIYRGTTSVNVSGSYFDPVAALGIPFTTVRLSFNGTITSRTFLTDVVTNANGEFWDIITIPTSIALQDIQIYGWDPSLPTPQENRNPITNIRLMSRIFIPNHALTGYNGNAIFVGESATSSGTIRDDQGVVVDSTQFVALIRNVGYDGSQEVGTPTSGSLASGSFSLDYQIPLTYPLDQIFIRSKIIWGAGLVHYRPGIFPQQIDVYSAITLSSFEIYLGANDSIIPITSGSSYNILGDNHRDITIWGYLEDQSARGLNGKNIHDDWNGSTRVIVSGFGGFFSSGQQFTGFDNVTWIWTLYHDLDNGTTLSTSFTVTFNWIALDGTLPDISIVAPANINLTALPNTPTTTIIADIFDPDMSTGPGYVSLGLNTTSITITIDGASYPMLNIGGSLYSYDWDTSGVGDTVFFISITALDFANNLGNVSIFAVIDVIEPIASISVTSTSVDNNTYATMNANGDISISGTLSDVSSSTGRNSGVDATSAGLMIRPQGLPAVLILGSVAISANVSHFNYAWNIFDTTTLSRNSSFLAEINWELVLTIIDNAGNSNQTILPIVLENEPPSLKLESDPPSQITEETFEVSVSYNDLKSGINVNFLYFAVYDDDDDTLRETYDSTDSEVTLIADTNATLTLTTLNLGDGHFRVEISIFDNVGNRQNEISNDFNILLPQTTTTTDPSTTTTPPGGPGGLRPIDLIQFLLLDIIALGSGIGIAVIFERVKARRKG